MAASTSLIESARRSAGLSQEELARRAGTSRPTLSAYEHGRKSPGLPTAERLLHEAGFELTATPRIDYVEQVGSRGRSFWLPTRLGRLPVAQAVATVVLPLHLNWSAPRRTFRLADRAQRARAYEIVLREGSPAELAAYVDGALLVDLWPELALPREIRAAWTPVIAAAADAVQDS
jgi:transcriptional regulator with XRE-family HTH domain